MKRLILASFVAAMSAVASAQTTPSTQTTTKTAPASATAAKATPASTSTTKTSASAASTAKPAATASSSTTPPWIKLPPGIPRVAHGPLQTPVALHYQEIKVGAGAEAESGKLWHIKYTGWRAADGVKFDSWDDHAQPVMGKDGKPELGPDGKPKMGDPQPMAFPQGVGRVIPGFDTGLTGMKVGGKRRIFIPWQLAYGTRSMPDRPDHPGIPAKSDLIFDVELIEVTDMPAPPMRPGMPPPGARPGANAAPPRPGATGQPGAAGAAPAASGAPAAPAASTTSAAPATTTAAPAAKPAVPTPPQPATPPPAASAPAQPSAVPQSE